MDLLLFYSQMFFSHYFKKKCFLFENIIISGEGVSHLY